MPTRANTKIDQVIINMYRMGTGDCFTLKFMKGKNVSFKMMIDCGCWNGTKARLTPYLKHLKSDLKDHVDVLVVTHEHKDHVLGFERGKDLFTDGKFKAGQIWMAWTEKDGDPKIERWKTEYGEKKKALAAAATTLRNAMASPAVKRQIAGSREEAALLARRLGFSKVLNGFADLHATAGYAGGLAGMNVVKNDIANNNISYFEPGDLIEDTPGLEGVRIFVLGPPKLYEDVKQEKGPEGEAYEHNDQLEDTNAFAAALNAAVDPTVTTKPPFDESYVSYQSKHIHAYNQRSAAWRRIDYDWLFSAGSFALRMSSRTNNLSLVLAIEFVKSGKVLLFPGDAEFGSWQSWQKIKWNSKVPNLTTEKLLNRVVFYKVAHHLSHNGTARRTGLDMMTSPDLMAMATLDYDVIPDGWTSTMPNVAIIQDLLKQTQGRTMIMNTKDLLFDRKNSVKLEPKIKQYRKRMSAADQKKFKSALDTSSELYTGISIDV